MVNISEVSKSFGGRELFDDVSLLINRGDRIGLVGPNGAGKSTLFSMILRQQEPDKGEITTERNVTIVYLPQESAPAGEETVIELATAISPEIVRLQKLLKAETHDHHDEDLHARFDELGGFQLESRAKKILAGLSFREK